MRIKKFLSEEPKYDNMFHGLVVYAFEPDVANALKHGSNFIIDAKCCYTCKYINDDSRSSEGHGVCENDKNQEIVAKGQKVSIVVRFGSICKNWKKE